MSSITTVTLGLALIAAHTTFAEKLGVASPARTTGDDGWETIWNADWFPSTNQVSTASIDTTRPYTLPLQAASTSPHCLVNCLSPLQLTGASGCSAAYMTDECVCLKAPVAVQVAITRCVSALCPKQSSQSVTFLGVSGSDPTLAGNLAAATRLYSEYCLNAYDAGLIQSASVADGQRGGSNYAGPVIYPASDGSGAGAGTGATGFGGFTGLPTAPAPAPTTDGVSNLGTGADTALPTSEFPVDPVTGLGGGSPGDLATPSAPTPPKPVPTGAGSLRDGLQIVLGLVCFGLLVFAGVF